MIEIYKNGELVWTDAIPIREKVLFEPVEEFRGLAKSVSTPGHIKKPALPLGGKTLKEKARIFESLLYDYFHV